MGEIESVCNLPARSVIAGIRRFGLVAVCLTMAGSAAHAEFIPNEQQTALTAKAKMLRLGMTRSQVIAVLGRPTGVVLPSDSGNMKLYTDPPISFELLWENPPCNPVAVDFDEHRLTIGWDQGRSICDEALKAELTVSTLYSCAKPDRAKLCR